jgi:nicotinamide-nucleotide amidase
MANAEIISIGSELLLGQVMDTNASWMAQRLTDLGVNLFYKTVVGDNPDRMAEVIERALERSDIVITGGGLGPTQDDITREIVAQVTNRKLIKEPELVLQLQERFQKRGMIMTPNNERQAFIPEGSIIVNNPNGTAPSFIVEDPRAAIFTLPGVPFEMKWLFDNEVAPYLRQKFNLAETIIYRVLKVAELGESRVDDAIGHLIAESQNPTVGVLAHPGQVDVRIAAKAADIETANSLIDPVEVEVRRLLGRHVFATDEESMEDAIGDLLADQGKTVSVYEDLTAGLLAGRLQTSNSEFFVEGLISNSEATTRRLLQFSNKSSDLNSLKGDAIKLTQELASCVRSMTGSDLGLALHAIEHPEEEAENLARGRTYISITDGASFKSRNYSYGGRGLPDRTRMSFNAIELLRVALMDGF